MDLDDSLEIESEIMQRIAWNFFVRRQSGLTSFSDRCYVKMEGKLRKNLSTSFCCDDVVELPSKYLKCELGEGKKRGISFS